MIEVLQREALKALPGRMLDVMERASQQLKIARNTLEASGGLSYLPRPHESTDLRTPVIEIECVGVESQEEGCLPLRKTREMLALAQGLSRLVEGGRGELCTSFTLPKLDT